MRGMRRILLFTTIGDLQKKSGIEIIHRATYHPSAGLQRQMHEPAIFELSRAADAGGALAATVRRESAKTRIELGLALYQVGGIGGAVTSWQLALADDPTREVYILPYLARGYFDLARYEGPRRSIASLKLKDHSSMVADVYSLAAIVMQLGRDSMPPLLQSFLRPDWIKLLGISRLAGE
jgi:hypothetical protein